MPVTENHVRPQRRKLIFIGLTLLLGTAIGLVLVETGLGYYASFVQSREKMDEGFLVYDRQLGWTMAPRWSVRHRHYDFDVRYTTNSAGLRGPESGPNDGSKSGRRRAFLGDSFTFGLGVNDDETFIQILNRDSSNLYLNAGIAGYSTDQEYLYLEKHLAGWDLEELTLVVYLANDLLDNTLKYPLQATMGKPLFLVESDGLQLANVPVPLEPKPRKEQERTLATMILGEEAAEQRNNSWRSRWQILRTFGFAEGAAPEELDALPRRLAFPLDLFVRLVGKMHVLCGANHVRMNLILMPGRSFVEQPESISAAFQDFLRMKILERQEELGTPVIDIAGQLRERYATTRQPMYHPNEGHLNPAGHRAVAEMLRGLP